MSSSFKKLIPVLLIVVFFAGGYLLSNVAGDLFTGPVTESVATKAQAFQARLNYLGGVTNFDNILRDARIAELTPITAVPTPESVGRTNPFIR